MIANYDELIEHFEERMKYCSFSITPLENSIKICWENGGKKFSEKYTFMTKYKNIVVNVGTLESFSPGIGEECCVSKVRLHKFLEHSGCISKIIYYNLSENEQDLEVKILLRKG